MIEVQRRLFVEVVETTDIEEVTVISSKEMEVHTAVELFTILLRRDVIRAEMIWDRVLGDKRMVFKQPRSTGSL